MKMMEKVPILDKVGKSGDAYLPTIAIEKENDKRLLRSIYQNMFILYHPLQRLF